MRAALYVRQSLDRTGEGLGVERQRQDCARLAEQRGWSVSEVVTDNDVSATSARPRPGFVRLLELVDRRGVDVVVCWAADRLVRQMRDLEDVIERCERAGVRLATVSGDLDLSTDAGRLVARILASVARGEVERKGTRQRRSNDQAAALGLPPGGPVPFGFLPDRTTHHPEQAAAIRAAYTAVLDGASLASIAREWTAAGLSSGRTRTAAGHEGDPSPWSAETVKVLLRKPRNAGLRSHRGEVVGPGTWEPIVDEHTWRAALAELDERPRSRQRPAANARYLLSGVARCGTCSATVNVGTTRPGYHAYRCREALGHVARRGDQADEYVRAVVLERLARPDAADLLVAGDAPDVPALRERARVLRARLDSVAVEFADGTLTAAQLRTLTERLRGHLADAEQDLAAAGRTSALAPFLDADDVAAVWDTQTVERRREVIATLMTVTLHPVGRGARSFDPTTVEIAWR